MRAVLYARVSTEEQTEGYSLDAQMGRCRDYCETQGWEVVSEYIDAGFSGRSARRPQFEQMMTDAEAGLFDVLVIHKLDRFSRSLRDTITYLGQLADHGIGFVSIQERFDYTRPEGRLQMHILAALAQWYSENLGQEIKKGLAQRAKEGLWLGHLSTGYCLGLCSECGDEICPERGNEDKGEGEVPIPHPIDSKAILLAFEAYASGEYTYESLAALLSAQGYETRSIKGRRRWTKEAIKETLKNPFYKGFVRYKGRLYPGKHQPIVSEELWQKCQEIRQLHHGGPRTHSPRHRTYLFAGLLRCAACGGRMRADTAGNNARYYRCVARQKGFDCSAPQTRVREDVLAAQMTKIISHLSLPNDWRERVLALLGDQDEVEKIKAERGRLEEKLRRLRRAYFEVEIDEAYYRKEKAETEGRFAHLVIPDGMVKIEEAAKLLSDMSVTWKAALREERRTMLGFMFEAIYCDTAKKELVALEPKRPFIPLLREIEFLGEDGEGICPEGPEVPIPLQNLTSISGCASRR